MLAARHQPPKSFAQPHLGFPADVLNRFRQRLDPALNVLGNLRRMAVRPGAFDQRAAGTAVAGLGDPALPPRRSA
jgi:hypothetical protein